MSDLSEALLAEVSEREGIPPIRYVAETGSTNADVATLAAEGAPHGTALVADAQTAGRGRLGRTWISPPGSNLYLSMLLRPNLPLADVPWLTLAAAVAGAETLGPIRIKWPNDLLADDGRKVAGILAEAEISGGKVAHVVVGIGVNVRSAPPFAASLAELGAPLLDRSELAVRWVRRMLYWSSVLHCGTPAVGLRWRELSCTLGARVRLGEVEGVATDLDTNGALRVRRDDGSEQSILAGEVEMVKGVY